MGADSRTPAATPQASLVAQQLAHQLTLFLAPLLRLLDTSLDAR